MIYDPLYSYICAYCLSNVDAYAYTYAYIDTDTYAYVYAYTYSLLLSCY